jgi:hypothetical protein
MDLLQRKVIYDMMKAYLGIPAEEEAGPMSLPALLRQAAGDIAAVARDERQLAEGLDLAAALLRSECEAMWCKKEGRTP